MNKINLLFLSVLFVFGCNNIDHQSVQYSEHQNSDTSRFGNSDKSILQSAKAFLHQPPVSVTDKPRHSTLSDSRTYQSMACYWWPDPNSDDGLPYIRKDGQVNPETRSAKSDLPKMILMAQKVESLASAFYLTNDEVFAEKALEQLMVWFTNSESAMYPHLEHAQMVKGLNTGRYYGVIDSWWLIRVIDSVEHLKQSAFWTDDIEQGLNAWFTHYLNWLRNSEFGQKEMQSKNNHGTWYDLQVVTYARFTGQDDFAKEYLKNITRNRISNQISMSGRQKHETRRTRPLHYSVYNLYGLMKLAQHGRELGVDLNNNNRWFSGSLEDAFHYLANRMEGIDPASLADPNDQTETDRMYWELVQSAEIIFY